MIRVTVGPPLAIEMPVIHRRVFYCKAGAAGQLVQHVKKANEAMARFGADMKPRTLTGHLTGRSERVVR